MVWQLCAIWTGCLASIVDLVTLLLCTTWICLDSLISCSPKIQKLLDLFCVTVWILTFGMPCTILMYYLAPLLLPNSTSKLDLSQFCSLYSFDLRNCTVVCLTLYSWCVCVKVVKAMILPVLRAEADRLQTVLEGPLGNNTDRIAADHVKIALLVCISTPQHCSHLFHVLFLKNS